MSLTFLDIQSEVKRRATRNQGGSQFDAGIKNVINTALFRLSRECNWKQLRRTATFASEVSTTTGTITTATNGLATFSGSGMSLITNGIRTGRRIQISGSTKRYIIQSITGENSFTTNLTWDGTTYAGTGALTITIFGTEDYILPIQSGRIGLIWHEANGYPFMMRFVTDLDFYNSGISIENSNRPVYWRQWGEDDVLKQPLQAGIISISSSSTSDQNVSITIYGTVSGYPDQETIVTNSSNGTTVVAGTKSFSTIERISKDTNTTIGRITLTSDSAATTVSVIPSGNIQDRFSYKHIQVWPLPNTSFNFNCMYYKDPGRLVNNNDTHELGSQFDEALIILATARLKFEQNMITEGTAFHKLYEDELKNLKQYNSDTALNWMPSLRRAKNSPDLAGGGVHRFLSYSQMGGSYGPAWSN